MSEDATSNININITMENKAPNGDTEQVDSPQSRPLTVNISNFPKPPQQYGTFPLPRIQPQASGYRKYLPPIPIITQPTDLTLRSITPPAAIIRSPNAFLEYRTNTRHLSTILFTPTIPHDSPASFCIRDPLHFGELTFFSHAVYLGDKPPPSHIHPTKYALGITRELPSSHIFNVGNPMVRQNQKAVEFGVDASAMGYACQNEVRKGLWISRTRGRLMRWKFKPDLSAREYPSVFFWMRRVVGDDGRILEMELREENKVLAVWKRGHDIFNGSLWLRKKYPEDVPDERRELVGRRWAVAVLLTWRIVLEKNKTVQSRKKWGAATTTRIKKKANTSMF